MRTACVACRPVGKDPPQLRVIKERRTPWIWDEASASLASWTNNADIGANSATSRLWICEFDDVAKIVTPK
jgi:hypothetical protein